MPHTHPRRLLTVLAASIVALTAAAAPANARAAKPLGPILTIEAKNCSTGTDAAARFIQLTASAVLRDTGDEVQMRFTVQQRPALKTPWRPIFAKTGDLGTWATNDAGTDGLRYTKTINGLAEGNQYRVLVDARGIDTDGDVVTKTTRKTFTCLQPQLSAALVLQRAALIPAGPIRATPAIRATIRNVGRAASSPAIITIRDAATQTRLGSATTDPIPGRTNATATIPIDSCPGQVTVTVQETGDAPTDLTPDGTLTIDCAQAAAPTTPASTSIR